METQAIIDLIFQQGIWCVLFCYLFYTNSKKADGREDKLNDYLNRQAETLKEITITLNSMNVRIEKVEDKLGVNV